MPAAVKMREDYSAEQLRALAKRSKDAHQSSAAAVAGGDPRRDGSRRGGQDRWDGPPDLARLGSSLQREGSGRPH